MKKLRITAGDTVLVENRDFRDEKVDIIHKYIANESRHLKQYDELPTAARISNETCLDMPLVETDDGIGINFDDITDKEWYKIFK